jgi:hypothetical protein
MNERLYLQLRFLFFGLFDKLNQCFVQKVAEYTYTERLGFYVSLRCFEGNFEKCFFFPS